MEKTLFNKYAKPPKKRRGTERGELFDFFLSVVNPSRVAKGYKPLNYGYLGMLFTKIDTKDLYALKSKMLDAERRGYNAGAIFWMEARPNGGVVRF